MSREEDSLALFERAEAAADSESQKREARWGQLISAIDLEHGSADVQYAELAQGVGLSDPREFLRAAAIGLNLHLRQGLVALDDADLARQLMPVVGDPLVRSSFLSVYGTALCLAARYEDALTVAADLLEVARRYRLDFALTYGYVAIASARSGLRQWSDAEAAAREALARAKSARDVHADLTSRAILLRLYAQQGRLPDAFGVESGEIRGAIDAVIDEFVGSRALVMACASRTDEARELVGEVRGTSTVEGQVLRAAVNAVCALRDGSADVTEHALRLEAVAFQTGGVDLLVTAYRSCPELLTITLRIAKGRRFRDLVERVGDSDLASAAGFPLATDGDRRLLLTPRETEVFELLRTGVSNREISKMLFIEESTVKAHTHGIYDKLGVRSRNALAVQAALERTDQATSATESNTESESP